VYFAKNAAYLPFNSWFSLQRLCRLLWGYHVYFVDSNHAPNNSVIPVTSWHVCLFWSARRRQPPWCIGLLNWKTVCFSCQHMYVLGSTVYFKLQHTKTALKTAQLKQQNKPVAIIVARGHITAADLWIKLRISTVGKSEYARVLGLYHSPKKGFIVKCGRPAGRRCTLRP